MLTYSLKTSVAYARGINLIPLRLCVTHSQSVRHLRVELHLAIFSCRKDTGLEAFPPPEWGNDDNSFTLRANTGRSSRISLKHISAHTSYRCSERRSLASTPMNPNVAVGKQNSHIMGYNQIQPLPMVKDMLQLHIVHSRPIQPMQAKPKKELQEITTYATTTPAL